MTTLDDPNETPGTTLDADYLDRSYTLTSGGDGDGVDDDGDDDLDDDDDEDDDDDDGDDDGGDGASAENPA